MEQLFVCLALVVGTFANAPHFPSCSPWYQDISSATLHPHSTDIINWFTSAGGFGGGKFQIDFSFHILNGTFFLNINSNIIANTTTPTATVNQVNYGEDCDTINSIPLPVGKFKEFRSI
jgi:hypothetical protein